MTTIKNIARPCGDCWTDVRNESLSFRFATYADEMYAHTGRKVWEGAAAVSMRLSMVDTDAVMALVQLVLACICIGFLLALYGVYGGRTMDVLYIWFNELIWRFTGLTREYAVTDLGDIFCLLGIR